MRLQLYTFILLTVLKSVYAEHVKSELKTSPPSMQPPAALQPISTDKKAEIENEVKSHPKDVKPVAPITEESNDDLMNVMFSLDSLAKENGIACPSDIVFVVDSTSSVRHLFEQVKVYMLKVVEGLTISDVGDRVSLVLFSGPRKQKERIRLGSMNDSGKLTKAIKNIPFLSGITATGAALNFVKLQLSNRREGVMTNIVVLTDGFSYDLIAEAAGKLQNMKNVRVFAVSIGESYVRSELELIAGSSDRVLYGPTSYAKLVREMKECEGGRKIQNDSLAKSNNGVLLAYLSDFEHRKVQYRTEGSRQMLARCSQKGLRRTMETATVHYVPTATDDNGRSLIPNPKFTDYGIEHIDDRRPEVRNFAKERLFDVSGPSCQNDIVFVFDSSGSLSAHFESQQQLANLLLNKITLGPNNNQVAAIEYSGKHRNKIVLNFTDSYDGERAKGKISSMRFMSGTTFTNTALLKALLLLKGPGSRPKIARPMVILFTDGYSFEDPVNGAKALREMGALVYAVGIDANHNKINRKELEVIAGDTSRVYLVNSFSTFVNDMARISTECNADKHEKLI